LPTGFSSATARLLPRACYRAPATARPSLRKGAMSQEGEWSQCNRGDLGRKINRGLSPIELYSVATTGNLRRYDVSIHPISERSSFVAGTLLSTRKRK
jgi:hypothetical protein